MSDMPNWNAMSDAFRHDAHFALRGVRRRPAFTAMVVTTFALGIGDCDDVRNSRSPALPGAGAHRRP
jgi:hypothetical protein